NVMQPIIGNVFSDLANEAPVAPPDLLAFTPPPTGPPVTLTVNLDPADGSGGNVTVDPPGPEYGPGSTVTLTPVPTDSSWVFIGWEGDLTGTTNPVTLYMNGDKTVTAKFTQKQYTLTLNESGNGEASSDPDEAEQFAFGQEVTLSADPDPDWLFVEWTGDYAGSDNPATFQFLDQNMTITAVFADTARTLTAIVISGDDISESPGPGGTIQADPPNTGPYPDGTEVTLTAVANPGWFFIGWTGSLSGDANPQTLLMDSDKSVSAIFQEAASNEYTLTTIPSGSGSITKNPDQTSYTDGTAVTLQAVPDLGWTFVGWSGDLTGSVNPETI
ncbi:MAG: hypothetical protein GY803_27780, partial [Chloroflexi bacterium]|nr:hypothetical protein [Chloroflexota bacterium]